MQSLIARFLNVFYYFKNKIKYILSSLDVKFDRKRYEA